MARLGDEQKPRNINLNSRDFNLLNMPQSTGGNNIPGILGMLQQQENKPKMPGVSVEGPWGLMQPGPLPPDAPTQPQVPQNPVVNPIQQIMGQLQKLMSGEGQMNFSPSSLPTFDPNRFKTQAEQAVNQQYDPIIQQILAGQRQTGQRARQNRVATRDLYAGAVNDINTGAAQTQKQYDQSQAQSKQLYTDERNRIAAGYAADAAAQRQEAKRLGIESLGMGTEAAIQQQNTDKQFADQMGSQQMQSSQQAFEQQQQAAGQYDKSIGQATQAEGIEAQGDIMRQLEDYLSQSNTDLANTRSQAAGQTTDLATKLAQAAYDRDAANAQFQYQQQRDFIGDQKDITNMQREMLMAQLEAAMTAQGQGQEKLNPWQQVATFADQLKPGQGSDIVGAIQAAMNERPEIYARSKEDPVAMNPALFAKLIADYQGNQGMDRNTLMQVSQELYRLLYGIQ